jgi:thiamine biosynthesis lipoprotein ApbE
MRDSRTAPSSSSSSSRKRERINNSFIIVLNKIDRLTSSLSSSSLLKRINKKQLRINSSVLAW